MVLVSEKLEWQKRALCSTPRMQEYKELFFSDNEQEIRGAKTICGACPVKNQCLEWALNNKEIWGVWGGLDEYELRVVLSVDEDGQEVRRIRKGEAPFCPSCRATTGKLSVTEKETAGGGRWTTKKVVTCSECDFFWVSRTSANAVEAYANLKSRTSSQE